MHGEAMQRICFKLKNMNYDLSKMRALEFFAREGNWQTTAYADKVKTLEAWEIDSAFEPELKRNLPQAVVRIGNSYTMSQNPCYWDKFDIIVIDNPQSVFGSQKEYCEHFEALEHVTNLMSSEVIVVFNVNRSPFNFENHPIWQIRRQQFYGVSDTTSLASDFLLSFYKEFFTKRKLVTLMSFIEHRNEEYLSYLIFSLRKSSK